MIRFVVGLFVFAVALCAFIVTRPAEITPTATAVPPQVNQSDVTVTRALSNPLRPVTVSDPVASSAPQVVPPDQPKGLDFVTARDPIDRTIDNVLGGLGVTFAGAAAADDPLANATAHALTGIGQATGTPNRAAAIRRQPAPETAFERMVLQALQARTPDAEIDAAINAAARAGRIVVPEVLVTANRQVDTLTLLDAILTEAVVTTGGIPPDPVAQDPNLFVTNVGRIYSVQPDDSLARIAARFYGSVAMAEVIATANRELLDRPADLRAGMALTLPAL